VTIIKIIPILRHLEFQIPILHSFIVQATCTLSLQAKCVSLVQLVTATLEANIECTSDNWLTLGLYVLLLSTIYSLPNNTPAREVLDAMFISSRCKSAITSRPAIHTVDRSIEFRQYLLLVREHIFPRDANFAKEGSI
jgi:hypothetical protein